MMHARNVSTSGKLQRVLTFLMDRGRQGATSWEIMDFCKTVAPATVVSELRHAGHEITCEYERKTEKGSKQYRYRLAIPGAERVE